MGKLIVKYLLDSVIVIDHLNQISQATDFILQNHSNCVLSVVTRAEVLIGVEEDDKAMVMALLDSFETWDITKQVADKTAIFRKTYRTKLPDAFQASLALHYNAILVTRNTKDFKENQQYFDRNDLVLTPHTKHFNHRSRTYCHRTSL